MSHELSMYDEYLKILYYTWNLGYQMRYQLPAELGRCRAAAPRCRPAHTPAAPELLRWCQLACLAVLQWLFIIIAGMGAGQVNCSTLRLLALVGCVGPGAYPMGTSRGQGPSLIDEQKTCLGFGQNTDVTECINCRHFVKWGLMSCDISWDTLQGRTEPSSYPLVLKVMWSLTIWFYSNHWYRITIFKYQSFE